MAVTHSIVRAVRVRFEGGKGDFKFAWVRCPPELVHTQVTIVANKSRWGRKPNAGSRKCAPVGLVDDVLFFQAVILFILISIYSSLTFVVELQQARRADRLILRTERPLSAAKTNGHRSSPKVPFAFAEILPITLSSYQRPPPAACRYSLVCPPKDTHVFVSS